MSKEFNMAYCIISMCSIIISDSGSKEGKYGQNTSSASASVTQG